MNQKDDAALVALTTTPRGEPAEELARALVEEGLAACVNRVDVASVFAWKGTVEEEAETLLVIKTTAAAWEPLCERVRELSSYEVPELIALGAVAVESRYLEWLRGSVGVP